MTRWKRKNNGLGVGMNKLRPLQIIAFMLAVLALLTALPSPAWAQDQADELPTLLLAVPLTGPLARFGQGAVNGSQLALKTLGGGFNMHTIDETQPWPEDLSLQNVPVISGYFTESALAAHAPRYIYLKKTVLLPFLGATGGAALDPANFFRLMPAADEEGEFLAMRALTLKRRPRRLLIIQGGSEADAALAEALSATLAAPIQPPDPPAPKPGQRKPPKPASIKPLDKNAVIVTAAPEDDWAALPEFAKNNPELIILAIDSPAALDLAPRLAASKFAKVPVWGGVSLGFREVGAAFGAVKLSLSLALPLDLADDANSAVRDFKKAYINAYKIQPTWISGIAYDSFNLAIKAVSATSVTGNNVAAFLNGHSHHALGAYQLAPGGGGRPPLTMMAVTEESLAYLP
jgi:ABC-type branched-subunit amino acid transport system substrate-binding protein